MSNMNKDSHDFVQFLPPEVLEMIFVNVGAEGIHSSLLTSKQWLDFVDNDSFIWEVLCRQLDQEDVLEDINKGFSWKAVFLNNQGVNGIVRKWLKGKYSFLKYYNEPESQRCMAVLDVNTWGVILEAEMAR